MTAPLGDPTGVAPVRLCGIPAGSGIGIFFLLLALALSAVSCFVPGSIPLAIGAPMDDVLVIGSWCTSDLTAELADSVTDSRVDRGVTDSDVRVSI